MTKEEKNQAVPIADRCLLTLEEAGAYTGIGMSTLRNMSERKSCDFVIWVGSRRMFKRKKLDEYLEKAYSV
ncbi:MAG: Excisionase from transposon Tn916 [Firmicutes bacterium ADurb.Bin300]|nr:MAG: Excisionase from transposon Tn916 [Firmicutes bacterium ADurb.Bin300]